MALQTGEMPKGWVEALLKAYSDGTIKIPTTASLLRPEILRTRRDMPLPLFREKP